MGPESGSETVFMTGECLLVPIETRHGHTCVVRALKMTRRSTVMLSCLALAGEARSEIIKPWKEWLCNYCAMGESEPQN